MTTPTTRVLCFLAVRAALTAGCSTGDDGTSDRGSASAASSTASASPSGRDPGDPSSASAQAAARAAGTVRPGWGPTRAEIARARAAVSRMSVNEQAGQVIVARYGGTAPPTALVRRYHLGGVIAMSDNIASVNAVRRSNATLQHSDARRW